MSAWIAVFSIGEGAHEHKTDYAHSASAFALAPGARARRGEIAGGLIFLSLHENRYSAVCFLFIPRSSLSVIKTQ